MRFSDLLFKYESNKTLKLFLTTMIENPSMYVLIEKVSGGYNIESTELFNSALKATKSSLFLNESLEFISSNCGCLQYYKLKECIHIIALYAVALYILDKKIYEDEMKIYKENKLYTEHKAILEGLSNELKIANPYFGLISLIPIIEVNNKDYYLSLKIAKDKEYVIKDIHEFISMTENHISYSYGQKLDFIHSYECFDSVSKEFYSFITTIASENSTKNIPIRKSHLLKILEIFKNKVIYYKSNDEFKALPRLVTTIDNVELKLDDSSLYIETPGNSKLLVSGVNNSYFIQNEQIFAYSYKSRLEKKLFEFLFKAEGKLLIDVNSNSFISDLLPLIRGNIQISDSFYNKYPIPNIKVNSYISYSNDIISLQPKIACKDSDRESPYIKQLLEGYIKTLEGFYFTKSKDKKFIISGIETQYKFLTSDISTIKSFGEVYFDENMKNLKAKKSSRTRVNISYNVGLLDFKFENNDLTIEEIQTMLKAYHEKQKFIKLKDNTILEIDEDSVKEIHDFLEDFNISLKELNKPINKPMNYLLKLVNNVDTNITLDDEIVKTIEALQNYKRHKYDLDVNIRDSLRPYQMDGFKWLKTLAKFGFGGILADDMGLGKTLEIIAFLASDTKEMPSLIVCPMSLLYNWENECLKWGFSFPVKLIIGSSEDRENIIASIEANKKVIYITSYDSLRRDVSLYDIDFRFIIADEAQYIKNQFAQKSEAIKSIRSEINYALTGTPIENGLADLWSIFDFLMPGYLSNYSHFKSRYETLIQYDDTEALTNLKKRVSPFILRRTKKDVLKDLPDKIEDYYYCKMENKQKDIYDAYVSKLKDDINSGGNNILALLTKLRQICITPELIYQEAFENTKIHMSIDLIKSSIESGHRILLFSQFAQSLPILSRLLERMNIKHFILEGSTKAKTRIEMVEEFNKNDEIKVFLISLKAGGTGLNLVGADMVIHLDPWWNSSAEAQATDRAYRIGQTKDVTVIKLICKDTIEEKVVELQKVKKELAESVVSDDPKNTFKLTKQDILELLD